MFWILRSTLYRMGKIKKYANDWIKYKPTAKNKIALKVNERLSSLLSCFFT